MDSSDSEAGASGGPTDVGSAARDTASPRTSPEKEEAKEVVDKKDEEEKKKEEEKKDEPNKPDDKKDSGGDGDEDGDNASDPWGTGGCSFAKDCHYYNGPSRPPDGPPPDTNPPDLVACAGSCFPHPWALRTCAGRNKQIVGEPPAMTHPQCQPPSAYKHDDGSPMCAVCHRVLPWLYAGRSPSAHRHMSFNTLHLP